MREPNALDLKRIRDELGCDQYFAKKEFERRQILQHLQGGAWHFMLRRILIWLVKNA